MEASFNERLSTFESAPAVAEGQLEFAEDDGVESAGGPAFAETIDASAAAQIILPQKPPGRRSGKNDPASRQGALQICHNPALRRVRPDAERARSLMVWREALARRGPHGPIQHDESELLLETALAVVRIFDCVNALLKDDLLRGMLELLRASQRRCAVPPIY